MPALGLRFPGCDAILGEMSLKEFKNAYSAQNINEISRGLII